MIPEKIQAWLGILGGILGPLAVFYWQVVQRKDTRRDRADDWLEKRDERAWKRMEDQLEKCHQDIAEKEQEIERLRAEREQVVARLQNDLETGWELARAWHAFASDVHFEAMTLCRMINAMPDTKNKVEMPRLPHFREFMKDK